MSPQILEQSSFRADSVPDESEQILIQEEEESLQIEIPESGSSFALLSSPVVKEGRLARQLDFLARLEKSSTNLDGKIDCSYDPKCLLTQEITNNK
jgi:hypothetical protein